MVEIVKETGHAVEIDASGMYYRELNSRMRDLVADGVSKVSIQNVCGQRYIGTDLDRAVEIDIFGTPGNDLGSFMNGPKITVHGNAQDGCGNTMNDGTIVVHGHAGDITGLSARGGKMFVRDDVGYRAGIHMKEYGEKKPVLVIGGTGAITTPETISHWMDSAKNIAISESPDHLIAAIGVEDLIIVHTPDATLICHRKDTDHLRAFLENLENAGHDRFV